MTFGSLRRAAFVAAIALVGTVAEAGQVVQVKSVPVTTTSWADNLSFDQFDASLGTLTAVCFQLDGVVEGGFRFESLDASPSTITGQLQATITLTRPNASVIGLVIPTAMTIDNVTAFDGVIDFGGTSGNTYANLNGSDTTGVISSSTAADLALFTGLGQVLLPIAAVGTSNATGSGNLITQFATTAGATVTLTYKFRDAISSPEPATIVSLLSILPIVGFAARRRKTA